MAVKKDDQLKENEKVVRRFIDEVWNKGNVDVADELLHPRVKLRGVSYTPTRQGEKKFVAAYRKAFPNMRFRITQIIADGNHVSVQLRGKGTHKGEWQGVAASNNRVTVNGSALMTLRKGKIVEAVHNPDLIGVRRDMGVVPKEAQGVFKKRVY
jgi:predicted ester cyclase